MVTTAVNGGTNRVFTLRPALGAQRSNSDLAVSERRVWSPPVDVFETPDAYHIYVDLPGLTANDLNITFERGALSITGRREPVWHDTENRAWRVYAAERLQGDFVRSIRLPEHVNVDAIEATFNEGVLTVSVPKGEAAMARRIPVNVSATSVQS